jgi:hypothetical protein
MLMLELLLCVFAESYEWNQEYDSRGDCLFMLY